MALVIARKVEVYLEFAVVAHAVHAEVLPPFPATALLAREYLFGIDDFRFVGRSDLLEHFVVAHIALADHDRDALLDDSGFFGCDRLFNSLGCHPEDFVRSYHRTDISFLYI